MCSKALGEIKALQYTGSVEDYWHHFIVLLCRCESLTPQHQLDLVITDLGQPLCSAAPLKKDRNRSFAHHFAIPLRYRCNCASYYQ
jgi:hypothetical protein